MKYGPRTHDTGLQRDIKRTASQPIISQVLGGRPQGHHLGVGGGIVEPNRLIKAAANYHAIFDYYRTNGHLACRIGKPCLLKGQAHKALVGVIGHGLGRPRMKCLIRRGLLRGLCGGLGLGRACFFKNRVELIFQHQLFFFQYFDLFVGAWRDVAFHILDFLIQGVVTIE